VQDRIFVLGTVPVRLLPEMGDEGACWHAKKMTWDFAKLAKRPFASPRDSTALCAGNPI